MKYVFVWLSLLCTNQLMAQRPSSLTITFGSCNKPELPQDYWQQIAVLHPDLFVWTGDIIYGDSPDTAVLNSMYRTQRNNPYYASFLEKVPVIGTLDDHDYGKNDGGKEWSAKASAKSSFMTFMGYDGQHPMAERDGIYYSYDIYTDTNLVRVILLDTRTFRDTLTPSSLPDKRYAVNDSGDMLGKAQWDWLFNELSDTNVDFFIVVSSVQVIAEEHGWEKWANLPLAQQRLMYMLGDIQPKALLFISGDRHIAEMSYYPHGILQYPLYDITASGLTHTWGQAREEKNAYRDGALIIKKNFGALNFHFYPERIDVEVGIYDTDNGALLANKMLHYPR